MDKSKYRLLYYIPPELRKHVEFVKGLPKIVADTVTDPNTYATLNQVLNPVEWVIAPVRNTRKFIDSGYKDVGALTNATIETLGLAAGPIAQKYASTLSPVASKGVSSGVKSLQELVMPLGASDDVAEEISKKTGVNRRQFIAGTAALGAASGLKGVGDIFPTSKVVKATAKSPVFNTVVDLNKLRGQFKAKALRYDDILQTSKDIEFNEEIGSLPSRMKKYDNDLVKFEEDALAKREELMDVVNAIEAEFLELTDNVVAEGVEGLSKLSQGELVNLRRTFTDEYAVLSRARGDFDYRISVPEDLEAENIINKVLENKGLMNLDDFRKSRFTVKNKKEAGELGIAGDYEYDFYGNLLEDKLSVVDEFKSPLEKDFNQGGLITDEQTQKTFNQGGMTMEQQMNLFEEGGMKDDGLDRDPISGNDIPPGSLAKEVRDDIPAQLSDGEYVVPADVVQYYGVKFFEDLRMEAKAGLKQMEETGRIGGEPVSVTMIALGEAEKKKKKKAQGGPIYANEGVLADQKLVEGASPAFNPVDYAVLGFTPVSPISQTGTSSQNNITKSVTYYHGETGESKVVTFVNGIVEPPEDVQYTQPPWSTIKPATPQTTTQQSDDRERKDAPPGWGADPEQYNFTGWDQDRWNQEVSDLLKPVGGGNLGIVGGFFETAGVANAITVRALMEAKGLDTSVVTEQINEAMGNLNTVQKGVVDFLTTDKLMDGHVQNVTRSNASYANYKGSPTKSKVITPTKKEIDPDVARLQKQLKDRQDRESNEDRRQRKEEIEKATKESLSKVTTDDASKAAQKKGGGAAKTSTGEMIKADEQTGFESRFYNKGGLLKKPKHNPKKPRGKGLGSK